MAPPRASASPSPIPSTETNDAPPKIEESTITPEQWAAMGVVLKNLYEYKDEDGSERSKVFQRKPNKRNVPDYYDVIQEPMALSTVKVRVPAVQYTTLGRSSMLKNLVMKSNISNTTYNSFPEFVRDLALIPHNAQVYNRPEAPAYKDALIIKAYIGSQLKELVLKDIISETEATMPDLGEIPVASPRAVEEEEEDDEDEDDEEDDDVEESDDDGRRTRKRRGPRSTAAITKREGGGAKDDGGQKGNDAESRKKRGRPPRVDTPMEARIKAVLKGIRKFKNEDGNMKVSHFERLPDKGSMPEYFDSIKMPMAIDVIKRKSKRKKYQSVDHFMKDMEIMFDNAKMYNEDSSQVNKDAVDLQIEARQIAEQEKKKPDSEYMMEDGRLPLPNGILHNGELWKVGDWVHIQNPNDLTKPIVAQIYRTWQDAEGQRWVNACWYYRPEQTVHRHDRHFYENEVVKTGQYRDHHIDEVIDRCFVMFFTRFNKGRPRGFPSDKEVYVCEARYNEEKYKLNKIKTWASCVPDEVRERDYEMNLFDVPKKMRKVPSPIKHLLKESAKETDDLPKPTWGVANAPPIVGAVHNRPREANESPPPEPTPSPPPQPPPPPPRQVSDMSTHATGNYGVDNQRDGTMEGTSSQVQTTASAPITGTHGQPSLNQQYPQQYHQQSASPAPAFQSAYSQQSSIHPPQTPQPSLVPPQPAAQFNHYSTPQPAYGYQQPASRGTLSVGNSYNPPRPVEVYHLSDSANLSIPEDIREQFQRDEHGHVLFFTTPPLDTLPPAKPGQAIGHSTRYLAEKARRIRANLEKRKLEQTDLAAEEGPNKTVKPATEPASGDEIADMTKKALELFTKQMEDGTKLLCQQIYGDRWEEGMKYTMEKLQKLQSEERIKKQERERNAEVMKEREKISLRGTGVYLDDIDPRY
ncbi:MAG: hypothetical protein M1827_000051 [Pycnora praestabilis]|nr:MAG: hypothetical protein M1827_000051 [Pycnora praestabilis]